jgi:hypothetical protein
MWMTGLLHGPAALTPVNNPESHFIGAWMGPRAGLSVLEKKEFHIPARIWAWDRPVRSVVTIPMRYVCYNNANPQISHCHSSIFGQLSWIMYTPVIYINVNIQVYSLLQSINLWI